MERRNYGLEVGWNTLILIFQNWKRLFWVFLLTGFLWGMLFWLLIVPRGFIHALYGYVYYSCLCAIGLCDDLSKQQFDVAWTSRRIWLVWIAFFGAFAGLATTIYVWFWGRKHGEDVMQPEHMEGAQLLTPEEHKTVTALEVAREKARNIEVPPYLFGAERIELPYSFSFQHMGAIGSSGTGKSTLIRELLSQLRERKERAVVVDLQGLYLQHFWRPGDVILSLYDNRAAAWSFEAETVAHENIAASLIEESQKDTFFWKGARAVLASLLRISNSLEELRYFANEDTQILAQRLKAEGEESWSFVSEPRQGAGIMATIKTETTWLKFLRPPGQAEAFSVSKSLADPSDKRWIFMLFSESHLEQEKAFIRLLFDLAVRGCLARKPDNPAQVPTWLIVDELRSVGRLDALPHLLDKGRKYLARAVCGFQTNTQLDQVYGQHDGKSLRAGLQNQFIFRVSEESLAKESSKLLGEHKILDGTQNLSFGAKSMADRGGIGQTIRTESCVTATAIQQLPDGQAYAKFRNLNPTLVTVPYKSFPVVTHPLQYQIDSPSEEVNERRRREV